jgi:hypothetical protein
MRNLRAVSSAEAVPSTGVVDTLSVPATDTPIADHVAYFRQHPKTQPPWLATALAKAGESLGGIDEDAMWKHSYVTGAVSGWLILCHLIGTVARGNFRLAPATLWEGYHVTQRKPHLPLEKCVYGYTTCTGSSDLCGERNKINYGKLQKQVVWMWNDSDTHEGHKPGLCLFKDMALGLVWLS